MMVHTSEHDTGDRVRQKAGGVPVPRGRMETGGGAQCRGVGSAANWAARESRQARIQPTVPSPPSTSTRRPGTSANSRSGASGSSLGSSTTCGRCAPYVIPATKIEDPEPQA